MSEIQNTRRTKTHAKDYLLEFASNPKTDGWLKDLIAIVVDKGCVITDEDCEFVIKEIEEESDATLSQPTIRNQLNHDDLRLIELEHNSGVCAIAKRQKIIFSNQVTLICGYNGSGKSSYFKILNKIAGGTHAQEIIPNIYTKTKDSIEVNIKYVHNGKENILRWDGSNSDVYPLNLCNVFDSSYTRSFLEKRTTGSAIIYPYGLHLFTAVTDSITKIKNKLSLKIDAISNEIPLIRTDDFPNELKAIITNKNFSNDQIKKVESLYEVPEESRSTFRKMSEKIEAKEKANFDDKIKIITSEKNELNEFLSYITDVNVKMDEILKKTMTLNKDLNVAVKECAIAKEKIKILNEIGNTDLDEWKDFIKSGSSYSKNIGEKGVCPYCRQPLNDNAKKILTAYTDYLKDTSQIKLNKLYEEKELLKNKINKIIIKQEIPLNLREILNSNGIITDVHELLTDILPNLKLNIAQYLGAESEATGNTVTTLNIQRIITKLSDIVACKETQIRELSTLKSTKDEELKRLRDEIAPIKANIAVSEQKNTLQDWFQKINELNKLKNFIGLLSTRSITTLSKQATKELINNKLKDKFKEELIAFGLGHLEVNLVESNASNGKSYVQIMLTNNNSALKILSEGEQKGVALALFIAERHLQKSTTPIIFDDPVNSLDHNIIAVFADRLLQLNAQIIIFSHSILLERSLMNSKYAHFCKNMGQNLCKKTNKHIYAYKLESVARDEKGVVVNWTHCNSEGYLSKVNDIVEHKKIDLTEAAIGFLRLSVECIIDEKVFNNLDPLKFHGKKSHIEWDKLKELNADKSMIDQLQRIYNRLSGGALHSGIERNENPIGFDEVSRLYANLCLLSKKDK